jgi:predicted histidine transporter YuiF (NhaC family)
MISTSFEMLKRQVFSEEINKIDGTLYVKNITDHVLTSRSLMSLKLLSAIFCMYEYKKESDKSFFSDDVNTYIKKLYKKDPSDFVVVFLFAIAMFSLGNKKRAEQLLVRLENSGWKEKNLASNVIEKLVRVKISNE